MALNRNETKMLKIKIKIYICVIIKHFLLLDYTVISETKSTKILVRINYFIGQNQRFYLDWSKHVESRVHKNANRIPTQTQYASKWAVDSELGPR